MAEFKLVAEFSKNLTLAHPEAEAIIAHFVRHSEREQVHRCARLSSVLLVSQRVEKHLWVEVRPCAQPVRTQWYDHIDDETKHQY